MTILDRHIIVRFSQNFFMLFLLLFLFAVSVDLILNLDKFVDAARFVVGEDSGVVRFTMALLSMLGVFHGPRLFQFYAYLHGLIAIGAMGFTLAQMHRHRELVALMSSGMSLHRVAVPFVAAVFALSLMQLVNQELIIPGLAPSLLQDQAKLGRGEPQRFPILLTADSRGHLLQAPQFDPQAQVLMNPTILVRDGQGRTVRRLSAESAQWSEEDGGWRLVNGRAITRPAEEAGVSTTMVETQPSEIFVTDLNPSTLLVRHRSQFASMLSLRQIGRMLDSPRVSDRQMLLRHRYSRFASVLIDVFVLALTLPCFLLREPANMLRQSVICAGLAIPATMGSAIGMMIDLPGIPAAVGVFLPVLILMFLALVPWTFFKS